MKHNFTIEELKTWSDYRVLQMLITERLNDLNLNGPLSLRLVRLRADLQDDMPLSKQDASLGHFKNLCLNARFRITIYGSIYHKVSDTEYRDENGHPFVGGAKEVIVLSNPSEDTPEMAVRDREITDLDYEDGVYRRYFTTPYDENRERVGQPFIVLKQIQKLKMATDEEDGEDDMYLIQFEDGKEVQAFGHEVCKLIYEKCSPNVFAKTPA